MHDKRDAASLKCLGDFYAGAIPKLDIHDRYVGGIGVQPLQRGGAGREDSDHFEACIAQLVFDIDRDSASSSKTTTDAAA